VHRQLNQASSDISRYSFAKKGMGKASKYPYNDLYLFNQRRALGDITDADSIRAVLRNETLEPDFVANFNDHVIEYASGDILLEDERCTVSVE
jgi:hypothetical protein